MGAHPAPAATNEAHAGQAILPKKWWQWVLLYPGLVIAVVGAVPTYYELGRSHYLGVPFGKSADAEEQNRLWVENFECTKTAAFNKAVNKKQVEISSAVCESGDVLLSGKRPGWDKPQLRWVSWAEVAPSSVENTHSASFGVFGNAQADDRIILAQGNVICQRWVGPGLLLQRIGTAQGCFDQVINTYNGWVVSTRPAPCAPC